MSSLDTTPGIQQSFFERWKPDTFENRTIREMQNIHQSQPREIGFFGKLGTAFSNETVTSELYRSMTSPDFIDQNYQVTDDDIEKFAGDLDRGIAERVALASGSLAEFLYELDQARATNRRRAELFSGGGFGAAVGLGTTLLAAGGEAVVLSILAGAAGTAIGGPVGAAAAGTATAASRITRLNRIYGAFKGAGIAAAIDVPLEVTRYELDKTLKPRDLIIALGASAGLTGAVGAWKPHLFSRHLAGAADTAAKREAADIARNANQDELADGIEAGLTQRIEVKPMGDARDSDFIEIRRLDEAELRAEAKSREISTGPVRDPAGSGRWVKRERDDIELDVWAAREKERPQLDEVDRQSLDDWGGRGLKATAVIKAARRTLAKAVGITDEDLLSQAGMGGKTALRNAFLAARRFAAEKGHVLVGAIPRMVLPTKMRAPSMTGSRTVKGIKTTFEFESRIEAALWAVGGKGKTNRRKDALRKWLEKAGIEKPQAAADKFVKETRARASDPSGSTIVVRASGLRRTVVDEKGVKKTLRQEEGQRAESLFQTKQKVKVTAKVKPKEAEVHPQDGPESVAIVNGNITAIGPSEFVEAATDAAASAPPRLSITGHPHGGRETASRIINYVPGDWAGKYIKGLFNFFSPIHTRLMKSNSPLIREWADDVLDNPVGGKQTVMGLAKLDFERRIAVLGKKYNAALEKARLAGQQLTTKQIYEAYRAEFVPEGPLGDIVTAMREHYKGLLKRGKEGGVLDDSIPDDLAYLQRRYNAPQFNKLIKEFGETAIIKFFSKAIRNKSIASEIKMTDAKADMVAKRIVDFGKNPEAARLGKSSNLQLDDIRTKLTKELEDAGLDDVNGQVDDFMDMIFARVEGEPHMKHEVSANRHRIQLDETHKAFLVPEGKTGPGREIRFDDFVGGRGGEEIIEDASRYAQQIIGAVEMREGFRRVFKNPDITQAEAIKKLKEAATDPSEAEFIEKVFTHSYNSVVGKRIYQDGWLIRTAMGINAFNQATIGMTLGFAQLPEMASVIMRTGPQAAIQQFPAISEIGQIFTMGIRDLATGRRGLGLEGLRKTKDDLASCVETFTGIAGDYTRRDHLMRRLDDMGYDSDYVRSWGGKYLEWGRVASGLNPLGIMPMDTFMRRWASKASFQHFVNTAYEIKGGKATLSKGFWKNSHTRFKQLGMDEADIERLSVHLKNPDLVTTEPGLFGKYTVKSFDLSQVEDQHIIDKFAYALRRHSDHMVQRQTYGESPYWVNTPMGKLFSQYRVFMLASRAKQAAMGAARGDAYEAANVVGSFGLGILGYYLQSYYRSMGMEENDRMDYLKERFATDRLWKAGIVKGSYASWGPMAIDTASAMITGETVFDPSMRTTGQGMNLITGSTAWTTGSKIERAIFESFGALRGDDEYSQNDLRNAASLFWLTKVPGIDSSIRSLITKTSLPIKD